MAAWLENPRSLVNRKRAGRLMRLMGLVAIYQRTNTSARIPARSCAGAQGLPLPACGITIERRSGLVLGRHTRFAGAGSKSDGQKASSIWWSLWIG